MRDEYRELWGDIPIVLCSEENYLGPQETYTKKQAIATAESALLSLNWPTHIIWFLLYSNLYLDENIQLICHIVPEIKKFIFIGDARQINQTNNLDIRK